jgi:hypothetical protein
MKKSILLFALIIGLSTVFGQKKDDVLFQYGNDVVTKNEFVNAFKN